MADNKPVVLILQILCLLSALLVIVSGCLFFVWGIHSWNGYSLAIWLIVFGIQLLLAEVKCFPVFGYVAFVYHPLGRGLWMVFLASMCFGYHGFQLAAGSIVLVTGLLYCILGELVLKGMSKPLTQKGDTITLSHTERWVA